MLKSLMNAQDRRKSIALEEIILATIRKVNGKKGATYRADNKYFFYDWQ